MTPPSTRPAPAAQPTPTTVSFGLSTSDAVIAALVCTACGAAFGLFLPAICSFAAQFPGLFGDTVEKLSHFEPPVVVTMRPIVGAVLGLVLAGIFISSSPRVTISAEEVVIEKRGQQQLRIARESISSVYVDSAGKLTILTLSGQPVFHGEVEANTVRLGAAFRAHGYRWGEI